jgi:hypothetical protein
MIRVLREAEAIAGTLGEPSKMPGFSYGIPARHCKVGGALVNVPGSVCSKCYALKGNYKFPSMQRGLEARFASLKHPLWVEAMVFMIRYRKAKHFRWHDSGDLQDLYHLEKIADVAAQLPDCKFWLPTREKAIIHAFQRKHGEFPKNLVVRVSGTMIDGPAPIGFRNTSTVVSDNASCPAHDQGNACGSCRRCWDRRIKNVSYLKH